jgi:uncharacterized protein YegP (UPF0339 family)
MMTFRPGDRSPIVTILHEATHVLIHYLAGFRAKQAADLFWIQEGIADFCAGFRNVEDGIEIGAINADRLTGVKQLYAVGRSNPGILIPFQALLQFNQMHWMQTINIPNPQQKQQAIGRIYIQGWALFYFLHHGEDGKYRSRLQALMQRVIETSSKYEDFQQAFAGVDLAQLEREFDQFIEKLRFQQ